MIPDDDLSARLRRLESADWSSPRPSTAHRRHQMANAALVAALLLLGGLGGAVVVSTTLPETGVRTLPGVFDQGQPLHCIGLDDMTLAQADRHIRDLGFEVSWQIERGDATTIADAPPLSGTIAGGVATSEHTILIVVDPTGTERNAAPGC